MRVPINRLPGQSAPPDPVHPPVRLASDFTEGAVDWLVSLIPRSESGLTACVVVAALLAGVLARLGTVRLEAEGTKPKEGIAGFGDVLLAGLAAALDQLPAIGWRFITGQLLNIGAQEQIVAAGAVLDRHPAPEPKTTDVEKAGLLHRILPGKKNPGRRDASRSRWSTWPCAVRAAIRLGAVTAVSSPLLGPVNTLVLAGVVVVIVAAVALVPAGRRGTDDAAIYGPGLWGALVQVLRLSSQEQERGSGHWLHLPRELSSDYARIGVRLPLHWLGSDKERAMLAHVIHSRLPGQWVAAFDQRGISPHVVFTPKPPEAPEPELPTRVEWICSDDPARVHLGDTHSGRRYVDTSTETPHWGISGGTGDGKTTVLLIPVVHGRQHGALVDGITMKAAAFKDVEGESGLRIHKSGRQAVAALAEFYVSMKAAEALQGTPEGDALPGRILVIDEFASFVKSAKIWWKYGLKGKGMPPFEAWFHMILMQGRSANHKIVVGAHTFTRELFGDTETRDLVGTKGIVGPASNPKWGVTYGLDAPRVPYHHEVKGRGVIGVTGSPDIEEVQYAYITPYARDYLRQCAPAPDWHARGEMAPWITEAALKEAEDELAIAEFLPGGAFMDGVSLVTSRITPGPGVRSRRSEQGASHLTGPDVTGDVTPSVTPPHRTHHTDQEDVAGEIEQAEEAQLPVFSLREACDTGILPVSHDGARKRMERARKNGHKVPEGVTVGGTPYYTAKELIAWWTYITSIRNGNLRSVPTM
ncbi:type IV secretory system conjugative DNA transfer family protein [Streptomyces sp. B-S-A8]|uniref:Type IV secretory system conjugative DNA transfer family protein n=1 Tax=Streptomyces solicavernae TaxID=3043614 RepID=A0ABT6S188_9ACTN|nr:type IV secretory system conjugative DNA transfer family protein [Streptomyces sp. B-S-A8]MDI3390456.1 type IV secretory system conjugative DNA transfer family protein [Streptomyces sp. B-S-A8]